MTLWHSHFVVCDFTLTLALACCWVRCHPHFGASMAAPVFDAILRWQMAPSVSGIMMVLTKIGAITGMASEIHSSQHLVRLYLNISYHRFLAERMTSCLIKPKLIDMHELISRQYRMYFNNAIIIKARNQQCNTVSTCFIDHAFLSVTFSLSLHLFSKLQEWKSTGGVGGIRFRDQYF